MTPAFEAPPLARACVNPEVILIAFWDVGLLATAAAAADTWLFALRFCDELDDDLVNGGPCTCCTLGARTGGNVAGSCAGLAPGIGGGGAAVVVEGALDWLEVAAVLTVWLGAADATTLAAVGLEDALCIRDWLFGKMLPSW